MENSNSTFKEVFEGFLEGMKQSRINDKTKAGKATESIIKAIEDAHTPLAWLDFVANNIESVYVGCTHVAKLTNSSSKASDIKDTIAHDKFEHLVSTYNTSSDTDSSYTSSTYAAIVKFLTLPVGEAALGDVLINDLNALDFLQLSPEKSEHYRTSIQKAYSNSAKVKSHPLAKQVYFPLGGDDYHLLSPMTSSALANHINECVWSSLKTSSDLVKAHKSNEWHDAPLTLFYKLAEINVTKSNHQNVSALNNTRSGRLFLFNNEPPKNSVILKKPQTATDLLRYLPIKHTVLSLRNLIGYLSANNIYINEYYKRLLKGYVDEIGEAFIQSMYTVRSSYPAGWTADEGIDDELAMFVDAQSVDYGQTEAKQKVVALSKKVAVHIASRIGDKNRSHALETLFERMLTPLLLNTYYTIKG